MLIKEYRIPLPLTVEEYRIAQLYMICKKSMEESKGADEQSGEASGVEILVNEPYTDGPGPGPGPGDGQFTHKVYHVGSHLPGWFKSLLPKSALTVEEKAWNSYPYTKTQFSCPFVEKFSLEIETYYTPDGGHLDNVFSLSASELRTRVVDHIDVVKDQDQNYIAEEDPTIFVSEKTGRGPLDKEWVKTYSEECVGSEMPTKNGKSIMCAYKLCKVEFRYWGMQSKIEKFIHDMALRNTMLRAHRQAWVWQDEWFGMTIEDIRRMERETAAALARTMHGLDEETNEDDSGSFGGHEISLKEANQETISANFNSIEYSSNEVPSIIPKGSEMLPRRSICTEDDSRVLKGTVRKKLSSDRISRFSSDLNPIESINRDETGESDDEFYDCRETTEDLRSLHRWNSLELVPQTEGEGSESAPPRTNNNPIFAHNELRRAVSYKGDVKKHPTIELGGMREVGGSCSSSVVDGHCSTTILILVVHGGSVLDPATELAVRKSDVTTLRGAFESIMRQHYPSLVGHVVIKCVPCPNVCSDSLNIMNNLSPYSFESTTGVSNDRIPIGAISVFATASPRYQEYVNQMVSSANKVYSEFLSSDAGQGFNGQVCLIGDSVGAILAYDALCRNVRRSASDNSDNEDDLPSPRLYEGADSPHFSTLNNRLSANSPRWTPPSECFGFDVAEFFIFGSPIGLLLAYRKVLSAGHNPGSQPTVIPRPNCQQVYNLFHPTNPVSARLEPLLSAHFPPIQPINIPRYQKYPMGDGQSLSILELIQSNPSLFQDPRTPTTPGRVRCPSNETRVSQPSNEARISYPSNEARVRCPSNEGRARCPSNEGRVRRGSNDSIVSGLFDTQQMQMMSVMKGKWWGTKRVDYALYCPEGLTNFPTNSLPHLFHSSYWESPDVISFILRQVLNQDLLRHSSDLEREKVFVPNQAREKWLRKRTSVKIKNGAANHRGNDVIVLEGKEQVVQGRFSYGPFDVAALSAEKVDVHMMKEPPSGEWTQLATETTDKTGRVQLKLQPLDAVGYGVYPIKMVVRGDHTVLDLTLTVVPPRTEAVVFSIDGSFTASVSVTGKDPKVRAGAVDIVRHWQDLGYLIIYVTGRPCMQLRKVVSWLGSHNFPLGMVSFVDGISTDPLRHKLEYLKGLQTEHEMIIHTAYGSSKDISVYSTLGLPPDKININGKISKKQQGCCNHITEGYVNHLGELTALGGSRPAQGNARMVIPKTCFGGLPGQFSTLASRRQATFRMSTKKYNSLPLSGHLNYPTSAPPHS